MQTNGDVSWENQSLHLAACNDRLATDGHVPDQWLVGVFGPNLRTTALESLVSVSGYGYFVSYSVWLLKTGTISTLGLLSTEQLYRLW